MHDLYHLPACQEEGYRIPALDILEGHVAEPVVSRLARAHREQLLEMRQVVCTEILVQVTRLVDNPVDPVDYPYPGKGLAYYPLVDHRPYDEELIRLVHLNIPPASSRNPSARRKTGMTQYVRNLSLP